MDRFAALFVTILALLVAPLSLYRVLQIKFSFIGGTAEDSFKLLEVIILLSTMQGRSYCFFCSKLLSWLSIL